MDSTLMTRENVAQSIELRVFEGPQRGARSPLAAGAGFVIVANPAAHPDDADIVLRDDSRAAARVRVTLDMRDALLEVLEGDVFLGDRQLAAGEQVPWGMHAPLKIGASVVAFGRAAVANWPGSLGAQAASTTTGDDDSTVDRAREDSTPAAQPKERKKKTPLSRRPEVWLASLGVIVLVVTGGAFGVAQVLQGPAPEKTEAPTFTTLLRGSEFSTLQATRRADETYDVKGRLETIEQRAKLDAWLAGLPFKTAVDVQVDESLARDVTETFRINGVSVQAQVLGTGTVAAEAAERDPNKLARAEEVARRDVRGLTKLTVRNTAQPLPKPLPPVADDPGKRIASLVPGDPGYVVTADGSRYFVGSMLPTGHRIAEVRADSVILELDGTKTTLNF